MSMSSKEKMEDAAIPYVMRFGALSNKEYREWLYGQARDRVLAERPHLMKTL